MVHNYTYRLTLILVFFIVAGSMLKAQQPRFGSGSSNQSGQSQQNLVPKERPDIQYFNIGDREEKKMLSDTSLNGFEIYAPNRTFENAALNLGNLGSSARRIEFRERRNIFTDIGYHQYDIYRLEQGALRFYKQNRPYNDLYFSPQSGQQNFQVGARFSRNLDQNMNIGLDYNRIKQEGFYRDQLTKTTSFGISLNKQSDTHEFYFGFLANNFNEQHNGGIAENVDSLDRLNPIFRSQRGTIQSFLDDATSRHQYFSYSADNFWKNPDSGLGIHHHGRIEHGYYRYSDESAETDKDSVVYMSYLSNDRGLRVVNKFRRISNSIDFSFDYRGLGLKLGASHKYLALDNSIETEHIHDASLDASLSFELKKLGRLEGETMIGIGENAGNFLLGAFLEVELGKLGQFNGSFHSCRYDAFRIQEYFVVTGERVLNNDFSKINELSIQGGLNITKLNLKLNGKIGLLDNPVFYNTQALPEQVSGDVNYLQLKLEHHLFWKFIGLDNEILYQTFSNNIYALPRVFSRHNLYLQTRIFDQRLKTRIGIQYYNIDFNGQSLSFMPANGAFYPSTNSETVGYYPITELYLNLQVSRFRIFFRIDNFTDMLRPDVHYHIENYPQFDNTFRMGVRWIFFD